MLATTTFRSENLEKSSTTQYGFDNNNPVIDELFGCKCVVNENVENISQLSEEIDQLTRAFHSSINDSVVKLFDESFIINNLGTSFQSISESFDSSIAKYITILNNLENIIKFKQLRLIDDSFKIDNKTEIHKFLQDHKAIIGVLVESVCNLKDVFGESAQYSLNLRRGIDSEEGVSLFVYIETSIEIDKALEKLEAFDNTWYLNQISIIGELLNFNLEPI